MSIRLVWWLLVIATAILLTDLHLAMTTPFKLASFDKLLHFKAAEPFQDRLLLPGIAAAVESVRPVPIRVVFGVLETGFWIALIALAFHALNWFEIGRRPEHRRLLAVSVVIPMAVHLIVPDLHLPHSQSLGEAHFLALGDWHLWHLLYYVYDVPAAAFTLGLMLLLLRVARQPDRIDLRLFYLGVFALATTNRETTAFMLPATVLVLWFCRPRPMGSMFGLVAAQVLIFAAIEWPLHHVFAHNANPSATIPLHYERHLIENLLVLSQPPYLITFAVRFTAGCYIPILILWRYLDRRLTCLLVGFALPLAVTAVAVGRLVEHRIFIEMVPLVWLAALQVISRYREINAS